MASAIRLTKAERDLIRRRLVVETEKEAATRETILEKLTRSELPPVKKRGISLTDAIAAVRGVLGSRLVLPPTITAGWAAAQTNRLNQLGMTLDLCRLVAEEAGRQWRGPIKMESVVRQADRLLHDIGQTVTPSPSSAPRAVFDLEDEEL